MKKILAVFLALIMFGGTVTLIWTKTDAEFDRRVAQINKGMNYIGKFRKSSYPKLLKRTMDKRTILMLGSSELPYYDEKSHPQALTKNGNSDFNIMLVGAAHVQCLAQAINVGALEPGIKNHKVVLNLSPQWFKKGGVVPGAFSSKFSPQIFHDFMENSKISKETKQAIINRCKVLVKDWPEGKKLIDRYDRQLNGRDNPVFNFIYSIRDKFDEMQLKVKYVRDFPPLKHLKRGRVIFGEIDFNRLLAISGQQGKEECTNNAFYINDKYFNKKLKPNFEKMKGFAAGRSYMPSPEYGDLDLFLRVCKELNLDVMMINVPVNGYWYDYVGFPKVERQKYYEKIRELAKEKNVELLDLTEHEYTPYFFKDGMHLGWKGWVFVNEGIYKFYKEDLPK